MNTENNQASQWEAFGRWVAKKRKAKGLTQGQAASLIDADRQTWYRIEKGWATKRQTVVAVANALEASVTEALTLAGFAPTPTDDPSDEDITALFYDYAKLTEQDKQELKSVMRMISKDIRERLRLKEQQKQNK
jgi:DNA-binding XRE family transcriptional regulator